MESISDKDRSILFLFDSNGDPLGRVEGGALSGNRVLAESDHVVTAAADSVTTLSESARSDYDTGQGTYVQAAAASQTSGAATFWFDTGLVDGTYKNSYVSVGNENAVQTGSVAGIVGTTAYCGDRNFAVVRQSFVGTDGNPTRNWLYETTSDAEPVVRGEWDYDPEFRPVTSVSPCSDDGRYLYTLYASEEAVTANGNGPGLTLVSIDTEDGTRSETQLDMPGYTWSTHRSSLTVVDNKLYWVTQDEDVLSVPLDGTNRVEKEWSLPRSDSAVVQVRGRTLSALSNDGTAVFGQFDLASGVATAEPIALPWLADIEGQPTEGGGTIYKIVDAAAIPAPNR
ncbi:hypothetical protein HQO82_04250 [Rhodococcus fascians]|nr:hypothetical protein [Rhodococcus fascians]MBY4113023.1 hypothetical protein [Rhodococcus fascians]